MKIVHIEDFFHPTSGYQISILPKYMVKQGHDVTIITSCIENRPPVTKAFFVYENIEKYDLEYSKITGVKIIRLPIRGSISNRAVWTKELFKTVEKLSPDVLYVHANDSIAGIRYILKAGHLKFPLVLDSHMLEMASMNAFNKIYRIFYKKFITPKIIKYKIPIIRTQDDNYIEKCLGIPLSQSPWISVGSDTILFKPDKAQRMSFRKEHDIKDSDFVVIYTGKLNELKGGKLLAEAFEKKFNSNKKVVLIVVGNASGEYGKQVEEIFARSENRIIRFPTQNYMDLTKFYQAADLSVFPKQCSLSFYDAGACGLPVVSEDNNINIDRLQHNNGFNFKAGNVDDFREKILQCINMPKEEFEKISINAYNFVKENYDYEDIADKYTDILLKQYKLFKESNKSS